jgi:hypothetical protein
MNDLESYTLSKLLLGIAVTVLVYYGGTRGVIVCTQRWAGRWYRRALVSLSFAVLFAPSLTGVGHGGVLPVPAWTAAGVYAGEGIWKGFVMAGVVPIVITWVFFFVITSFASLMSKNKNNKVDIYGKEP